MRTVRPLQRIVTRHPPKGKHELRQRRAPRGPNPLTANVQTVPRRLPRGVQLGYPYRTRTDTRRTGP